MTDEQPNRWPAVITALAVLFLAALGGSMYWGITRASRVSDPAYYTRGLGYGARLQAEKATRDWVLELGRNQGELALRLTDETGAPLADLQGTLAVQAPDGTDASRHELDPGPRPGEYRISLPSLPEQGVKAVVEFRRDGAVLRRSVLLAP